MQIGPRIRIGGSVGKAAQSLKENVGAVAKKVAPLTTFIPGVGPAMAAMLGAAGTAMDTRGGSVGIGDIAKSGLTSYAGAKAIGSVKSALSGGNPLDKLRAAAQSELGRATDRVAAGNSPVSNGGNSSWENLLKTVGKGAAVALPAALGAKQAMDASNRQGQLMDKQVAASDEAAAMARQLFAGAAPIRQAAESGMQARLAAGPRPTPDVSALRNTANPFASQFVLPRPPAAAPAARPAPVAVPAPIPGALGTGMDVVNKARRLGNVPMSAPAPSGDIVSRLRRRLASATAAS